jgi:hypothetical protein
LYDMLIAIVLLGVVVLQLPELVSIGQLLVKLSGVIFLFLEDASFLVQLERGCSLLMLDFISWIQSFLSRYMNNKT